MKQKYDENKISDTLEEEEELLNEARKALEAGAPQLLSLAKLFLYAWHKDDTATCNRRTLKAMAELEEAIKVADPSWGGI